MGCWDEPRAAVGGVTWTRFSGPSFSFRSRSLGTPPTSLDLPLRWALGSYFLMHR